MLNQDQEHEEPLARVQPKPRRMVYEFPLRPDFAAQVVLPYDLTRAEAKRLRALLRSMAVPDER